MRMRRLNSIHLFSYSAIHVLIKAKKTHLQTTTATAKTPLPRTRICDDYKKIHLARNFWQTAKG